MHSAGFRIKLQPKTFVYPQIISYLCNRVSNPIPKEDHIKKSNYIKNVMKKLSVIVCLFMFALLPLLAQVKQTVAVLGDSYSTFEGFIPKGYATWYTTAVQKQPLSTRWSKPGGGRLSRKVVTRWATSIPIPVPPSATPATAMRITATVHSSTALPCWAIRTSS